MLFRSLRGRAKCAKNRTRRTIYLEQEPPYIDRRIHSLWHRRDGSRVTGGPSYSPTSSCKPFSPSRTLMHLVQLRLPALSASRPTSSPTRACSEAPRSCSRRRASARRSGRRGLTMARRKEAWEIVQRVESWLEWSMSRRGRRLVGDDGVAELGRARGRPWCQIEAEVSDRGRA